LDLLSPLNLHEMLDRIIGNFEVSFLGIPLFHGGILPSDVMGVKGLLELVILLVWCLFNVLSTHIVC
jgi:hypothetical protein